MSTILKTRWQKLIGTWKGDSGMDIAPKPEKNENNLYNKVLVIEPVDIEIKNTEEKCYWQ